MPGKKEIIQVVQFIHILHMYSSSVLYHIYIRSSLQEQNFDSA